MRLLHVIVLLSGLALFSSDAASLEAVVGGTITRLDAETCRVGVGVTWVGDLTYPMPSCEYGYEVRPYINGNLTSIGGPFGIPEQMSPEPESFGDGRIFWVNTHVGGAFNFRPASGQTDIAISCYFREEEIIEVYCCDQSDPCLQPCDYHAFNCGRMLFEIGQGGGTVYAEIPQGIGDSTTFREIPTAVTDRTWSQMKSLFRR